MNNSQHRNNSQGKSSKATLLNRSLAALIEISRCSSGVSTLPPPRGKSTSAVVVVAAFAVVPDCFVAGFSTTDDAFLFFAVMVEDQTGKRLKELQKIQSSSEKGEIAWWLVLC